MPRGILLISLYSIIFLLNGCSEDRKINPCAGKFLYAAANDNKEKLNGKFLVKKLGDKEVDGEMICTYYFKLLCGFVYPLVKGKYPEGSLIEGVVYEKDKKIYCNFENRKFLLFDFNLKIGQSYDQYIYFKSKNYIDEAISLDSIKCKIILEDIEYEPWDGKPNFFNLDKEPIFYKFRFSGLNYFYEEEDWVFYVNYKEGITYYYGSERSYDGREKIFYFNGEIFDTKEQLYIEH